MFDVVALGELLIDFAPHSVSETGYPVLAANPGGAPGNFLAALNRYGCRTAMIGKVGDDMFGRLLIGTLRDAGIETRGVLADPDQFTTLAFVSLDETGNRDFSFARKPGADTCLRPEEVDEDLLRQARVFHFGTLSLTDEPAASATRRAVSLAKENRLLISLDPNLRKPLWRSEAEAKAAMEWSLHQADIVKISDEEIDFLWGLSPEAGAEKLLKEFGVSLVYVTLGPKGCYARNASACVMVESPSGIHVVDTTGAGDIFGGSAMSQFLKCGKAPSALAQKELESIVTFACTAASLSTQTRGGITSVPSPEAVLAKIGTEEHLR
jgi:fructokinase